MISLSSLCAPLNQLLCEPAPHQRAQMGLIHHQLLSLANVLVRLLRKPRLDRPLAAKNIRRKTRNLDHLPQVRNLRLLTLSGNELEVAQCPGSGREANQQSDRVFVLACKAPWHTVVQCVAASRQPTHSVSPAILAIPSHASVKRACPPTRCNIPSGAMLVAWPRRFAICHTTAFI